MVIGAGSRQNKKHLETAMIDNDFEELWGSGIREDFLIWSIIMYFYGYSVDMSKWENQ